MLNHIIGVDEASRMLNLSPGTVKNYCAEGKIIAKKIGKTWVIDKNTLGGLGMKITEKTILEFKGMNGNIPYQYWVIKLGDELYFAGDRGKNQGGLLVRDVGYANRYASKKFAKDDIDFINKYYDEYGKVKS